MIKKKLIAALFLVLMSSALAQDSASAISRREALRNEINERWFNTKVPDWLEERKNEEAAYSGPGLPADEYEEILKFDSSHKQGRISSLVDPKVYSSLQHQMNSKYLLAFLQSGQLIPRSGSFGRNSEEDSLPGVYLELHKFSTPKPFAWGDVEVNFDYSLLDREDYILTPCWSYGAYGPLTASPLVNPGRVAYYIRTYLLKGDQNEVVFLSPVTLASVRSIVVKTGTKRALLVQIKNKKIKCPQMGDCESLIVERSN